MDDAELAENIFDWLNPQEPRFKSPLKQSLDLFTDLDMWPDLVDEVSEEQAVLCWAVVEKLRRTKFPDRFLDL